MLRANKIWTAFLLRLALLSALLAVLVYCSGKFFPQGYVNVFTWSNLTFFAAVAALTFFIALRALLKRGDRGLVTGIFAGMAIKFFLAADYFILVLWRFDVENKFAFFGSFILFYAVYTLLAVGTLIKAGRETCLPTGGMDRPAGSRVKGQDRGQG